MNFFTFWLLFAAKKPINTVYITGIFHVFYPPRGALVLFISSRFLKKNCALGA